MSDLMQYYDKLIKQSWAVSKAQCELSFERFHQVTKPKLSNLFISLDAMIERDEKIDEKYECKEQELQRLSDLLDTRIQSVEKQLGI